MHRASLTTEFIDIPDDTDPNDTQLIVTLTCRVRIEERAGLEFESVAFFDAAGAASYVRAEYTNHSTDDKRFWRQQGELGLFVVPEDTAALVLYDAKAEMLRVPLVLTSGELNVVRP